MTEFVLAILVVGFAAHRLARALALDTITDPFRYWLWRRAGYGDASDEGPPPHISLKRVTRYGLDVDPRTHRLWKWCYGLFSCPFCCGWWIALALFFVWQGWSWLDLLGGVAAAGVQATLASVTAP